MSRSIYESLLSESHPGYTMAKDFHKPFNEILYQITRAIVVEACQLNQDYSTVVTPVTIQSAVRVVLRGELIKHAVHRAMTTTKEPIKEYITRKIQEWVGQEFVESNMQVEDSAWSYFGGIIEYLMNELCDLAGFSAAANERKEVEAIDLFDAIKRDVDLYPMYRSVMKEDIVVR